MKIRSVKRLPNISAIVPKSLALILLLQILCHNCDAATNNNGDNCITKEAKVTEQPQDRNDEPAYFIPEDPDQLILQWDLTGGFRAPAPQGFERKPNLQVFADGRIVAGVNGPEYKVGRAKLSQAELKKLLDFIVVQQKYFETSEADIRQKMDGYQSKLADGLTSTILIELRDQQQSIAVYALSMTARDFKEWQPIQRLKAIEARLRNLKLFATAGGDEGIREILDAANQELRRQGSKDLEFVAADLTGVTKRTDGSLVARLSKSQNEQPVYATVKRASKKAALTAEVKIGR